MTPSKDQNLKITSIYYLSTDFGKNGLPPDPTRAQSRVRIEVGGPESNSRSFYNSYETHIFTTAEVARIVSEAGFLAAKSILIVETFTDECIVSAVEKLLRSGELTRVFEQVS